MLALTGPLGTRGELRELALEVIGLNLGGRYLTHLTFYITHQTVQAVFALTGVHADSTIFARFACLE
jgi:hypothetical protein